MLALYPTAIFFIATFSESLFAFLALSAIYYALKNNYRLAGILVALATITRVNGVFVLILVASILFFKHKQKISRIIETGIIGSMGLLIYMGALYIRFKNPFEFIKTQQNHGWLQHSLFTQLAHISTLNALFLLPVIVSVFYWWKREKAFQFIVFYIY